MTEKPNFVLIPDDAPPPAPVRTDSLLGRLKTLATTAVTAAAAALAEGLVAAMEQLLEHLHAVGAHGLHQRLEAGDHPVVDIEEGVFARAVDAGRLDDGQSAAAFGPGNMIGDGVCIEGMAGEVGAVHREDGRRTYLYTKFELVTVRPSN